MSTVSSSTDNGLAIPTRKNQLPMISAAQTRYWWFDRSDLRESFSPVQNSVSSLFDRPVAPPQDDGANFDPEDDPDGDE